MSDDRLSVIENNVERIEGDVEKIDKKVDNIGKALELLARIEERLITVFRTGEAMSKDLREVTVRVTELEKRAHGVSVWGGIGDKILWVIFGAAVSWFVSGGMH